jgi:predicted nucleotidyltransferase
MSVLQLVQQKLAKNREILFQKYDIESLAIFGSVSRGDDIPTSDVDILVSFQKPIGIRFIDLADELEELLGSKVDLVSKNAIKPRYFRHIEPELNYV